MNHATECFRTLVLAALETAKQSQSQLARRSGVAQTTTSGILRSNKTPTIATAERIAEGLGVPLCALLTANSQFELNSVKPVAISEARNISCIVEAFLLATPKERARLVAEARSILENDS